VNAKIVEVKNNSVADLAEIRAGDVLKKIDDTSLRDIIDFQIYSDEPEFKLNILRDGQDVCYEIKKMPGESLGLKFSSSIFNKVKCCKNKCVFCFIDQLPIGVRKSLLIKDDDYRLSFLYGNFITLTNLEESDLERIIEQRLSPLYISLHSTNPMIRSKLMRTKGDDKALKYLKRLLDAEIRVHIQIVLCPGINDGDVLMSTLSELSRNYNGIESVGIVPVGLTMHREGLYPLRSFASCEAANLIEEVKRLQEKFLKEKGSSWVFLADEFYLLAKVPLPNMEHYQDFPQIENGVGLARLFLNEFEEALNKHADDFRPIIGTVLTGEMAEPILKNVVAKLEQFGVFLKVKKVPNRFFGGKVSVTGLITGSDILELINNESIDGPIILPDIVLNEDKVFLDDLTVEELKERLKVSVSVVPSDGKGFIKDLIKLGNRGDDSCR